MTFEPETPLDLIDHPELIKMVRTVTENAKYQVDMSLVDEMQGYVSVAKKAREKAHAMRLPDRYQTEADLHELAKFFKEVQANRDRVIEIKIGFLPLRRSLKRIMEEAVALLYQYPVVAKVSPAPARDAIRDKILGPLRDVSSKVEMMIEIASEVDRHLGNAHFSLKELKAIGIIYIEGARAQRGV